MRGEQSAEVLDLRMGCLGERLSSVRALTRCFASADTGVVDNAVGAAGALPTLDRCADVAMLRAVVRPPDDPAKRAEVDRLREEVAKVNALASAGRCDQAGTVGAPVARGRRRLGYKPLEAEIAYALGRLFDTCLDPKEALARPRGRGDGGRGVAPRRDRDRGGGDAGRRLRGLTHDVRAGRQWVRPARRSRPAFRGHPLLEARVAACGRVVLCAEGRFEEALREEQRVLAIRNRCSARPASTSRCPPTTSRVVLHELGRDEEAATSIRRRHRDLRRACWARTTAASRWRPLNEGEILTALGRFDEARAAIANALADLAEQGASSFYVGCGLLDLGKLELAERQPARGGRVPRASRCRCWATQDAPVTADAQFALARALRACVAREPRAGAGSRAQRARRDRRRAGVRALAREIEAWRAQSDAPSAAALSGLARACAGAAGRTRRAGSPACGGRCRAAPRRGSGCRRSARARRRIRCALVVVRGCVAPPRRTVERRGSAPAARAPGRRTVSAGSASTVMRPPSASTTARSITLRSSRMLPGQR